MPNAYIVEAVRTAGGKKGGRLRDWHPISLGAAVLDGTTPSRHPPQSSSDRSDGAVSSALVERSGADPNLIDDVIVGCVSQTGGQAGNIGRNMVRTEPWWASCVCAGTFPCCYGTGQLTETGHACSRKGRMQVLVQVLASKRIPEHVPGTSVDRHASAQCARLTPLALLFG
jgi:acetyl-CoA C-acetyltransferase